MMYQQQIDGDHCCRICLANLRYKGGIDIFGDQGRKEMLPFKIRKFLYITINVDDNLPKIICTSCFQRINAIYQYSLQAAQNQRDLGNHFKNRQNLQGILRAYLTSDVKTEKDDTEYTFEEVDPMMLVQCSLDEDTEPIPPSEEINYELKEKPEAATNSDLFYAEYPAEVQIWSASGQTKRILLNKNHEAMEIYEVNPTDETITQEPNDWEPELTCPICGKVATTKETLRVHVETHRPKGKYECNKCGRVFKTSCNLHRHQECHSEVDGNKFRCPTCGRLYTSNSTLRAHSITHSNVRPHKCPHCVKTFKRNQDLKFHINQHTGARPYQCPYCPKAFASSGNCFSHRKRMHPVEVERDRERAAKIMR